MKSNLVAPLIAAVLGAGLSAVHAEGIQCGKDRHETATKVIVHHAVAVVHTVNRKNGTVSVLHEPVRSLNWPAMTKTFVVDDQRLFDRLAVGKKVCIAFQKRRTGYVITAVE